MYQTCGLPVWMNELRARKWGESVLRGRGEDGGRDDGCEERRLTRFGEVGELYETM
jgi:hypothetical protein